MTTRRVQGVTTAAPARSEDRSHRMRVYLLQMGVRTLCFVAALFTHGWLQLALILGAVALPYIAVVSVNNAGPERSGTLRRVDSGAAALPVPEESGPAAPQRVVLTGDVVADPVLDRRRALPGPRTGGEAGA